MPHIPPMYALQPNMTLRNPNPDPKCNLAFDTLRVPVQFLTLRSRSRLKVAEPYPYPYP